MNEKVLIIDDEFELCMLLRLYLVGKKYDVEMAYNLKDGLKKLESYNPDILFLDNNLPDGTGWDIASKIVEAHPAIKITLISGVPGYDLPEEMGKSISVMPKPLSRNEINEYLNYIHEGKL